MYILDTQFTVIDMKHYIQINNKNGLTFDSSICTINESIKGDASQSRYGITFDGNIDVMYIDQSNKCYLRALQNSDWILIYLIVFNFLRTEIKTTGRKPSYRRLFTYQRKRKPSFKSFLYGNHFSNIVCCLLACHSRFTRFLRVRRATQRAHLRIRNANRMNDDQITFAEICPLFRFPRAAAAIQQSESDCKMGSKPF